MPRCVMWSGTDGALLEVTLLLYPSDRCFTTYVRINVATIIIRKRITPPEKYFSGKPEGQPRKHFPFYINFMNYFLKNASACGALNDEGPQTGMESVGAAARAGHGLSEAEAEGVIRRAEYRVMS